MNFFSLGRTAEAPRAIIGSKSAISLQRGPVNHSSSSQKTRLNDLSHGIKISTEFSSVLSQCTRLTDRRREFSSLNRVSIPCSAVNNYYMKIISIRLKLKRSQEIMKFKKFEIVRVAQSHKTHRKTAQCYHCGEFVQFCRQQDIAVEFRNGELG